MPAEMGHALIARVTAFALVVASVIAPRLPVRAQGGTALAGRVVQASDSSIAIPRARITVSSAGATRGPVYSDDDGRFAIEAAPGLTLTIARAGFVTQTVTVDRATSSAVDIRLESGGAITCVADTTTSVAGQPGVGSRRSIQPGIDCESRRPIRDSRVRHQQSSRLSRPARVVREVDPHTPRDQAIRASR